MLDLKTFGDSPAAVVLVKIINERNLKFNRVSRLLEEFNRTLNSVNKLPNQTARILINLYYKDALIRCERFESPLDIYTKNVITTIFKKWFKKYKNDNSTSSIN
jgi:hypothetical protein